MKHAVNEACECRVNELDTLTLAKIILDNRKSRGCPSVVRATMLRFQGDQYQCLAQNCATVLKT